MKLEAILPNKVMDMLEERSLFVRMDVFHNKRQPRREIKSLHDWTYQSKRRNSDVCSDNWRENKVTWHELGVDYLAEWEGGAEDPDFVKHNTGPGKKFSGRPKCKFQGIEVPVLLGSMRVEGWQVKYCERYLKQ